MRYHHGHGCDHGGWHQGYCDSGPEYGSSYGFERGWGHGWDAPVEVPRPRGLRGRFGGGAVARQSTATQLEGYLESLRDEMRAIEQDLRDLRAADGGSADTPEA